MAIVKRIASEGYVDEKALYEANKAVENLPQADWNQNDEAVVDFIKNRPFYEKTGVTSIVLFDGHANFWGPNTDGELAGWYDDELKNFENGKTYTVTIDNEQQDILCENDALIFVSSELNMTFILGEQYIYIEDHESFKASYHIKIETTEVSTTIKQLDEKFIPDTIARVDDIPIIPEINYPVTSVNGMTGDVVIDTPEQVQADWNQNDEAAVDFIKNRPFYEETGVTSIVLFDGYASFIMVAPEVIEGTYDELKEFEIGKTYTVTVGNEKQDVVCQPASYDGFETKELTFVSSELNMTFRLLEFAIVLDDYDSWEPSYYIKIETTGVSTTIKQLDEKFIPDTIARKEYVNEAIANLVGDTAVSEQISTAISESVADWNQNDETAPDFIKNRTHYDNIVTTSVVLADEEVSLLLLPDVLPEVYWSEPITLENGKTYTVTVNDVNNGTVCEQELVCENDELIFDSPEELQNTLTIKSEVIYGDNEGTYHIKIETTEFSTAIKQLDEKFIPNTIARVSDIPDVDTMQPLTFMGAVNATYDGSQAVSVEIPTDDHINSLINTALGVIENGTY